MLTILEIATEEVLLSDLTGYLKNHGQLTITHLTLLVKSNLYLKQSRPLSSGFTYMEKEQGMLI